MSGLSDISFPSAVNYTFLDEIGRGGMGIVYLAEKHCEEVSDIVVLKTIRSITEKQIEALKREANVAALLRHENIVRSHGLESVSVSLLPREFQAEIKNLAPKTTHGAGQRANAVMDKMRKGGGRPITGCQRPPRINLKKRNSEQRLYLIVMDYIEGADLLETHTSHLRHGLLIPLSLSAFIVSRICRALDYAHEFIVHRDISPENILINNQGVAKLSDFGIAVVAGDETAALAGKVQYMAPEQILKSQSDKRSDIFSLGLVAYQMATGVSIFSPARKGTIREQMQKYELILKTSIKPPHEVCSDIPLAYSKIIMKMLEINPEKRYQTAGEACTDMERKFLYAEGFGPTNNSLAAYIKIAESKFKNYTREDLMQLSFLAEDGKRFHLKRRISKSLYLECGLNMLKQRRVQSILKFVE